MLINNQHFSFRGDNVVFIQLKQLFSLDGVIQKPNQGRVGNLVEIIDTQVVLNFVNTRF